MQSLLRAGIADTSSNYQICSTEQKPKKKPNMYQVELIWNREFHFVPWGNPHAELDPAIKAARDIEESGDGARVKKTQIVDDEGIVVWAYGRKVRSVKKRPRR
jgi:hypothetical protein